MFFFHPVRRARRKIQPRAYRKVRHPVRSAAWTASGVGRKRPPRPKKRAKGHAPTALPAWANLNERQLERNRRLTEEYYSSGAHERYLASLER